MGGGSCGESYGQELRIASSNAWKGNLGIPWHFLRLRYHQGLTYSHLFDRDIERFLSLLFHLCNSLPY